MKRIAIIQTSLREVSSTRILCNVFQEKTSASKLEIEPIDLRSLDLEFCDGRDLNEYNSTLVETYKKLELCDVIIFGMPVYQYSMSGVLKNFIDICGGSIEGKSIGVLVNAGGPNCYMASRDLLDCLYYEYGTTNLAPTPYSWSMDFKDGKLTNQKVIEKIDDLIEKIKTL